MKQSGKKCPWLFMIFCLLLLYPAVGKVTDKYFPLNGVTEAKEKNKATLGSVFDGKYQEDMSEYLLNEMPGRNLLVKTHNQILYSVFHVSSNSNIVVGKNEQLFEPEYLNYSLNIWTQPSDEEVEELINKLTALDNVLAEDNKQLYIFITPSKARYYREDAPLAYELCADAYGQELAYDKFVRNLQKTELKVFDSIDYINKNKDSFEFPLWYSTGIHWSRALGSEVGVAFNRYLRETSGYDMGQVQVTQTQTGEMWDPDADLYKTLNLLMPPKEEYYIQQFTVEEGTDKPNVFYRGGSFMGQSINCLITNHIFEKDVYFENNYYFTDCYSGGGTLSNFDAYDELDVATYLEQSDILVLEVNENKIWTMSWGFIDYLLDYYEVGKGE